MDQKLAQAVEQFQKGDQNAFETVYTGSFARIKSGLNYMLKDEALAEDLTQETMIKVYQNIGDLKEPEKYLSWANTIAANLAKDYLKKGMASEITFSSMDVVTDSGEELSFEDSLESDKVFEQPEKAYDAKETERLVREIIDELPEGQRIAITLFYYNDMKVKEIARVTGVNENAVNQSLYQAKKKIEKKVRKLEKKGVKLYSLAPFAFFLWLFKAAGETSAATAAVVTGATAAAAAATAAAAAGTAGSAAAGTAAGASGIAGWIAGLPTAVKVIAAAVVGAGVIGGGTGIAVSTLNRQPSSEETVIETVSAEEITTEAETESVPETAGESLTEESETESEEESPEETESETEEASGSEEASEPETGVPVTEDSSAESIESSLEESSPAESESESSSEATEEETTESSVEETEDPLAKAFKFGVHVYCSNGSKTEGNDAYDMTKVKITIYTKDSPVGEPTGIAVLYDTGEPAEYYVSSKTGDRRTILLEPNKQYRLVVDPGESGYHVNTAQYNFGSPEGKGSLYAIDMIP